MQVHKQMLLQRTLQTQVLKRILLIRELLLDGRFQEQRSAHFLLHQHARRLQQASPRRDGIARKMCLIDWMFGIAAHHGFKAIVGFRYGLG